MTLCPHCNLNLINPEKETICMPCDITQDNKNKSNYYKKHENED